MFLKYFLFKPRHAAIVAYCLILIQYNAAVLKDILCRLRWIGVILKLSGRLLHSSEVILNLLTLVIQKYFYCNSNPQSFPLSIAGTPSVIHFGGFAPFKSQSKYCCSRIEISLRFFLCTRLCASPL